MLNKTSLQNLKIKAQTLKPVVLLGQHGLTEAVIKEINLALDHHELIKVKIAGADRDNKMLISDSILEQTKAELVQMIGHVLVLYRKNKDK